MTKRTSSLCALTMLLAAALARASGPPPTPEPPPDVSAVGTIAPPREPGGRLVITGRVFAPDGATPVAGVIVYAYQTDAAGHYQNDPRSRIARLHGWAKTDAQGRFEFRTIRPGPYPGRDVPAHVHFHVWGGGFPLQWTEELLFAGDPLIKPAVLEQSRTNGRFGNVSQVTRGSDGAQHCSINFRLLQRTNYPAEYQDDPRARSGK